MPNQYTARAESRPSPNPSGLCMCGCGETAPIAKFHDPKRGRVKGQPHRFIRGHNARTDAPKWKIRANGCWFWLGRPTPQGYAMTWFRGKSVKAHRAVYITMKGAVPDGLGLDHLCHNADLTCSGGPTCLHRRCVNPDHLEPVSILPNIRRSKNTNAGKTRCHRGHPFDEGNTLIVKTPWGDVGRQCRTCSRERAAIYRARTPLIVKSHCQNGHELVGDNVRFRVHPSGKTGRVCRTCAKRRSADFKAKERLARCKSHA